MTVVSINTRNSQSISKESFSEISENIQDLGAHLQANIVSLQAEIKSSAESIASPTNRKALANSTNL